VSSLWLTRKLSRRSAKQEGGPPPQCINAKRCTLEWCSGERGSHQVPDDETAAKLALSLSSAGAIRTETLRAFTEDEYRDIIAALP